MLNAFVNINGPLKIDQIIILSFQMMGHASSFLLFINILQKIALSNINKLNKYYRLPYVKVLEEY